MSESLPATPGTPPRSGDPKPMALGVPLGTGAPAGPAVGVANVAVSAEVEGQQARKEHVVEEARDNVRREISNGNLCVAYDRALAALRIWPDDPVLAYRSVLALARSGATDLAARRLEATGLTRRTDLPEGLDIDVPAMQARLLKDAALTATGAERSRLLRRAAEAYREPYDRLVATRGVATAFPAINAAACYLWAGDREQAAAMAQAVLRLLPADLSTGASYWDLATAAEAHLVLGDVEPARRLLTQAGRMLRERQVGWTDGASTRRQLRRTCLARSIDPAVLSLLAAPTVVAYTGHRTGPRFRPENEAGVRRAIERRLADLDVVAGYGSLAAGSDILFAEALIELGAELQVVLPFRIDDFIRMSVGPEWLRRFENCLAEAIVVPGICDRPKVSLRQVSQDPFLDDDAPFYYGSRVAFGNALLRAWQLDAPARLLAVWDGRPPDADAITGTATEVGFWHALGRPIDVITPEGALQADADAGIWLPPDTVGGRINAAILFGDIKGFSRLRDEHLQTYVDRVLGAIAGVLQEFHPHVLAANTWGDAFFAVIDDVGRAADCALRVQQALAGLDTRKLGLPEEFTMRIGGHFGPVRPVHDPVQGRAAYMGSPVVRAARIEPVAEPGMVWVTEEFAAALALERKARFAGDYLGEVELAKGAGRLPLHRLRRRLADEV